MTKGRTAAAFRPHRPGTSWALVLVACGFPGLAFACALPPSIVLTLPTGHYIAAAAVVVALTALLGATAHRLPELSSRCIWERRKLIPVTLTSYLSFLVLSGLLIVGWTGSRDPMHNLMTLVFWTGVWIALPLASLLVGNLWRPINPWTGPARMVRLALGRTGGIGLSRLGHWPAVAGYAGFAWFQIISLYPDDPAVLATLISAYYAVIFLLAVVEGEDWLERGEFLTVLFAMIARISPLWLEVTGSGGRVMAGYPGAQVLRMAPLDRSAIVFVVLVLSALTFDGLNETFWWQALIGQNPLEPMGRSAVAWPNILGLGLVFLTTALTLWAVIRLGHTMGGGRFAPGPVMLSFLAIAAGYHVAHYLVMLLTAGQYTLAALNDPFFTGDSLLGLPPFYVSFGFLTDPRVMPLIYGTQFLFIVLAHLLAVVVSLKIVGPGARAAAHLPMTTLMVAYTVLGLWLLSTARSG